MELKQIHYFLMLSQNGNMTSVAQSLYITQQALSKSILKLEEELEVPLFDRTVQGLRLTDYGRCLLPYAQKLVRDHDAALMAISEQKHAHKTAIQMGFVSGSFHAGSAVTPAMLSAWEKEHAQSAVFVQESSPEELIRMVLDEDIEIAYIVRPSPALPAGLNAAVLRHDPLAVLLSDSMLPEGVALDFRSLASMPILIGRIGSDPSQEMQGFFEHAGYPPRIMYYNGPISQCFERVRMGEGVMISGRSHLLSANMAGMRVLPFPDASKEMLHLLIWKKGRSYSREVRQLIDSIRSRTGAQGCAPDAGQP
ncbi:MAG: LysR family transcriptional regulator [Aristaeellaceae bacterium]